MLFCLAAFRLGSLAWIYASGHSKKDAEGLSSREYRAAAMALQPAHGT